MRGFGLPAQYANHGRNVDSGRTRGIAVAAVFRWLLVILTVLLLNACGRIDTELSKVSAPSANVAPATNDPVGDCPLTEPLWAKPPEDTAVPNPPDFGFYFVNADRSIWASAWWVGQEQSYLRAGDEGVKVGWFRPEGAVLEITGKRIDGQAASLESNIPCCYPTRFQATGIYFPAPGCWEITATAGASELSFVVFVEPE